MTRHLAIGLTGFTLFAILALSPQLVAQSGLQDSQTHHTHYNVIDPGALGGPSSHQALGAHILNNNGMFTGFADTPQPDPYAPDGCWDGDCLAAHVSLWRNGELSDLGALDAGPN